MWFDCPVATSQTYAVHPWFVCVRVSAFCVHSSIPVCFSLQMSLWSLSCAIFALLATERTVFCFVTNVVTAATWIASKYHWSSRLKVPRTLACMAGAEPVPDLPIYTCIAGEWFCDSCSVRPTLGTIWVPLEDVPAEHGVLAMLACSQQLSNFTKNYRQSQVMLCMTYDDRECTVFQKLFDSSPAAFFV